MHGIKGALQMTGMTRRQGFDRWRVHAATRAADTGATAHGLMAIFGWLDIKEAEICTREADRKRLAAQAMNKLEA